MNDVLTNVREILAMQLPPAEAVARIRSALLVLPPSAPEALVGRVASSHGVGVHEIMDLRVRHATVVRARHEAFARLHDDMHIPHAKIAEMFDTGHATVVSGANRHRARARRGAA